MEYCFSTVVIIIILTFTWPCLNFLLLLIKRGHKPIPMPPGPYPFPIIGNILKLSKKPHQTLSHLSNTYGPMMTLKLGNLTTIVISSPEIAKEALTKNDSVFSDREIPDIMRSLDHHKVSVVWLSTSSPKWRILRKICVTNMFSPQKLDFTRVLRQKKVQELLNFVNISSTKGEAIDIGEAAFTTVINSLSNTFFSMDFTQYSNPSGGGSENFIKLIEDIMEESGKTNIADFFPILRLIDPQGVRKRGEDYTQRLFKVFNGIIDERLRLRASEMDSREGCCDALDSFLNLIQENDSEALSRHDFLHLLVVCG
ncbi:Cytochrome P450 [Sesbania bispinosa]|nr:Cytochrome P450 [Sesbania bispinosa]